eukprot:scaffold2630_cov118-Isochrysis_galbana.AAC.14
MTFGSWHATLPEKPTLYGHQAVHFEAFCTWRADGTPLGAAMMHLECTLQTPDRCASPVSWSRTSPLQAQCAAHAYGAPRQLLGLHSPPMCHTTAPTHPCRRWPHELGPSYSAPRPAAAHWTNCSARPEAPAGMWSHLPWSPHG